eukprot:3777730-Prymnesium_polylepis.2
MLMLAAVRARRCSQWAGVLVLVAGRALAADGLVIDDIDVSAGASGAATARVAQLMAACATFAY